MEHMARLALLESNVKDYTKFKIILFDLVERIGQILENPNDSELRTINSVSIKSVREYTTFLDYLEYVGFVKVGSEYKYPQEEAIGKLRLAQAAIAQKIEWCFGAVTKAVKQEKKHILLPAKILNTNNRLLLKLEAMFNDMLQYEDQNLQAMARDKIPVLQLRTYAIQRMEEQQRKMKDGIETEPELTFAISLLMELLFWFKNEFMEWVGKPPCDQCEGPTTFTHTVEGIVRNEKCLIEKFRCGSCAGGSEFPRHNSPAVLLQTRRGRCGEWASCFLLMCRAMDYDTRYVYDITDHVWCEVFNVESNTWLHIDPCEGMLDAPLIYSVGWGKKLSYVLAVSKDDLQDVTWRYTNDHSQVLERRTLCTEQELLDAIVHLRAHRQKHEPEERKKFLAIRTLKELSQLMNERKQPTEAECSGRMSGEMAWRLARGEAGAEPLKPGGDLTCTRPGTWRVDYCTSLDKYTVCCDDKEASKLESWNAGAFVIKNVFRKVEKDWNMVYLAREEGKPLGEISWRLNSPDKFVFDSLTVKINTALYENGKVTFSLKFDNDEPQTVIIDESGSQFERVFQKVLITATLEGGNGHLAWQHSQLCRQQKNDKSPTLQIIAHSK